MINTLSREELTAVSIPIEVIFGVAMALVTQAIILACWAMCEGDMVVCNVIEEVEFVLLEHQCRSNGMHRRIAPSFVKEATSMVQRGEIIDVRVRAKPVKVTDFKVGPLS